MAVGNTITDSLADSIPTMIASARIVREFAGVMPNLVDRQRLDENTGTVWNEVSMAKLSAQAVTENTELVKLQRQHTGLPQTQLSQLLPMLQFTPSTTDFP